ncbi:MAG: hypothetical protein AWU57_1072 [Marinobacter sp. T13-3]|jgi:hypothetical protein|nr:MAG: hypothetical protein AWU57_1072 [Marinobacter sp. T13-3]
MLLRLKRSTSFVVSLAASAMMVGCASGPDKESGSIQQYDLSAVNHHLFGKLEHTENGYEFTEFNSYPNKESSWVRLTDLSPQWDTSSSECTEPLGSCNSNQALFMETEADFTFGRSAQYIFLSAFSMGIGLFGLPMEVTFNRDEYLKAANEAVGKIEGYKEDLLRYDNMISSFGDQAAEVREKHLDSEAPSINLVPKDESGLYVHEAFANNLPSVRAVLKNLPRFYVPEASGTTIEEVASAIRSDSKQQIDVMRSGVGEYEVRCSNRSSVLSVSYECPQYTLKAGDSYDIPITIKTVDLSVYKDVAFNPVLSERNRDGVEIVYKNNRIGIRNYSENYMKVRNVTYAYGGQLYTRTNFGRVIPPESEAWLLNGLDDEFDPEDSLEDMTEAKLRTGVVELGAGVEYEMGSRIESIFRKEMFYLSDIPSIERLYGL